MGLSVCLAGWLAGWLSVCLSVCLSVFDSQEQLFMFIFHRFFTALSFLLFRAECFLFSGKYT